MAKYRLTETWVANDPVRILAMIETNPVTGEEKRIPPPLRWVPERGGDLPFCIQLEAGTEIEMPDTFIPDAKFAPLDDAAHAVIAAHPVEYSRRSGTVNDLPNTVEDSETKELSKNIKSLITMVSGFMSQLGSQPAAQPKSGLRGGER